MALQKQKREQDLKEQREAERNSPAKKKSSSATSLLCAKKSNKRKRHNSPFKKGKHLLLTKAKLLLEAKFFIIIFTYLKSIYRSKMAKEYLAA
jgi:hypothetical protein